MTERRYAIGERVWATVGGSGFPRPGVVTGLVSTGSLDVPPFGATQYYVLFDGSEGQSGPCLVHRAEGGREAAPADIGTA